MSSEERINNAIELLAGVALAFRKDHCIPRGCDKCFSQPDSQGKVRISDPGNAGKCLGGFVAASAR